MQEFDIRLELILLLGALNGGINEHDAIKNDAKNGQDSRGRSNQSCYLGSSLGNLTANTQSAKRSESSTHHGHSGLLAVEHGTETSAKEISTSGQGSSA